MGNSIQKKSFLFEEDRNINEQKLHNLFGGIYSVFENDCKEYPDISDEKTIYAKITRKVLQLEQLTKEEAGYVGSDEATVLVEPKEKQAEYCVKISDSVPLLKLFITENDDKTELFVIACRNGRLRVAKWLKNCWPEIVIDDDKFSWTCSQGHLQVAQWLEEKWPEIKFNKNNAFIWTCINGHLLVAQWLKAKWPEIDHRIYQDHGFKMACSQGHLHVAKWLKETWPETDIPGGTFRWACGQGHLHIIKWLKEVWPNIDHSRCYSYARENNRFQVSQWLKENYPEIE